MKPTFSLQKILDFREFQKKQAQIELGKAIANENRIQQELEQVAKNRISAIHQTDKESSPISMFNAGKYYKFLDLKKEELLQDLAKAKIVSEEKRAIFSEAFKKEKILQNLREKRILEQKKQAKILEQKKIDEIATNFFEKKP